MIGTASLIGRTSDMKKDLDVRFNSLDLDQLARIFYWEDGWDANEFIDQCDEWWWDLTPEEKEDFYYRHS